MRPSGWKAQTPPHGARWGRPIGAWDAPTEGARLVLGGQAKRRSAVRLARSLGPQGPWREAWASAMRPTEAEGPWPVRALVVDAALALGLGAAPTVGLLASALLWHAAADALDDAMDGDAPAGHGPPKSPWARTATGGLAFMQLAPELACEAAPWCRHAALRGAFARSGRSMAQGQDQDMALAQAWAEGPQAAGPAGPGGAWAAWAKAAWGKAGGAMALYASLPALALGAKGPWVGGLWSLGEALGLAWQLSSDLADAPGPGQSPGLEQLLAWAALEAPEERALAWASWEGEAGAPPWDLVRELSGAGALAQAHLASAWAKAEALAEGLEGQGAPSPLVVAALGWVAEGRAAAKLHHAWGAGLASGSWL